MPNALTFIAIVLGILMFTSGLKHAKSSAAGALERMTNILLLVFVAPGTFEAFGSLSTASAQQLFVFISGVLGSVGAAFSLSSLPPIRIGVHGT